MLVFRAILLALVFLAGSVAAQAQTGGQMPPCVERFIPLRQETEQRFTAAQNAIERKAQPPELCRLFSQFTDAEAKMVKYVEENGPWCNFPPDILPTLKARHLKSREVRNQACAIASRPPPPKPREPSLSDALGAPVPDANTTKTGRGTFDSLTGNPLAR